MVKQMTLMRLLELVKFFAEEHPYFAYNPKVLVYVSEEGELNVVDPEKRDHVSVIRLGNE